MHTPRGLVMVLAAPIAVLALLAATGAWAGGSDVTLEGKLVDIHSDDFVDGRANHH